MEKPVKVLLVEDNLADAVLIKETLKEWAHTPFEIERVERVSAAIDRLAKGSVDVVLADLGLPDAQGLDVIKKLQHYAPLVPLVVLTGTYADESLAIKALQIGAQDYLVKEDVKPEALARSLRYAIERKEAERQVTEKQEELVRSQVELENLQLFAFVASHDMQEPLHKIQTFASYLHAEFGSTMSDKARESLSKIESTVARMSAVIEDATAFSRVTTAGRPFEPLDLAQIFSKVVAKLEPKIKAAKAKIDVGRLPKVKGDPGQIALVFENLLTNAIKFRQKERAPHVRIKEGEPQDGWVEFVVSDNGIGFDMKYVDRIFKPFQRLHTRAEFEGTGLGLAICQKIILRHGGKMTAFGAPGEGATFSVILPREGVPNG